MSVKHELKNGHLYEKNKSENIKTFKPIEISFTNEITGIEIH